MDGHVEYAIDTQQAFRHIWTKTMIDESGFYRAHFLAADDSFRLSHKTMIFSVYDDDGAILPHERPKINGCYTLILVHKVLKIDRNFGFLVKRNTSPYHNLFLCSVSRTLEFFINNSTSQLAV